MAEENGTEVPKKRRAAPRPQSAIELSAMAQCNRIIHKLKSKEARARVVAYLSGAALEDDEVQPPPVDDPRQLALAVAPLENPFP